MHHLESQETDWKTEGWEHYLKMIVSRQNLTIIHFIFKDAYFIVHIYLVQRHSQAEFPGCFSLLYSHIDRQKILNFLIWLKVRSNYPNIQLQQFGDKSRLDQMLNVTYSDNPSTSLQSLQFLPAAW